MRRSGTTWQRKERGAGMEEPEHCGVVSMQGRASGSAPVAASVQEGEHSSTLCVLGRAADGTQHRGGFKAPSGATGAMVGATLA